MMITCPSARLLAFILLAALGVTGCRSAPPPGPEIRHAFTKDGTTGIQITAEKGKPYQLQGTSSITQPDWQTVGPAVTAEEDTVTLTDTNAMARVRYYRITTPRQ